MKKIILIVVDGLSDESIPALGNRTPLEIAKTPNFNFLAKNGITGLVLPWLEKGKLPTSEDTHLALFGYNPKIYNPGRGVLEVLGIGLQPTRQGGKLPFRGKLSPPDPPAFGGPLKILAGDVCLRGNFATLDKNLKIRDRRAGRIENTLPLIRKISGIEIEGVKFLIGKAISHRIGIILRLQPPHFPPTKGGPLGKKLSPKISDGDPKKEGVKPLEIKALDNSKEARFTAKILNQFLKKTHLILKNHPLNKKRKLPANYILVRGAGSPNKKISKFYRKYQLKAAFIAGGFLYKGIGRYLGMDLIKVKGATGLANTNLKAKFLAAEKALKKYDFIFLHIKATDNLAEDGNFLGKKDFIEKIDKNLDPLLRLKDILIIITADHSTCSILKKHCKIPMPILIYGLQPTPLPLAERGPGKNGEQKFSEKDCKKGKLGRIKQINLMSKILKLRKNE